MKEELANLRSAVSEKASGVMVKSQRVVELEKVLNDTENVLEGQRK